MHLPAPRSHSDRRKGPSLSLHTNSCSLNPHEKHAPTQSPSTTHQAKPFDLTHDTGHGSISRLTGCCVWQGLGSALCTFPHLTLTVIRMQVLWLAHFIDGNTEAQRGHVTGRERIQTRVWTLILDHGAVRPPHLPLPPSGVSSMLLCTGGETQRKGSRVRTRPPLLGLPALHPKGNSTQRHAGQKGPDQLHSTESSGPAFPSVQRKEKQGSFAKRDQSLGHRRVLPGTLLAPEEIALQ